MPYYTASIETTSKGTFIHPYHLGTQEWIARECIRDHIKNTIWDRRVGIYTPRTIGLMQDGKLVDCFDCFDGRWHSELDMWADEAEWLDGYSL